MQKETGYFRPEKKKDRGISQDKDSLWKRLTWEEKELIFFSQTGIGLELKGRKLRRLEGRDPNPSLSQQPKQTKKGGGGPSFGERLRAQKKGTEANEH